MNLPTRDRAGSEEKGRRQDDLDEHVEQLLTKKGKLRGIGRGIVDFVSTRQSVWVQARRAELIT